MSQPTSQSFFPSAQIFSRLVALENNEFKITYFESVSATSGSLSVPTGATLEDDEFGESGNAILSSLASSGKPNWKSPLTAGGVPVTVSLNTSTGAWVASDSYVDANVAIIYVITIKSKDVLNLTEDNIIGFETISEASRITNDSSVSGSTVKDALETLASGGGGVLSFPYKAKTNSQTPPPSDKFILWDNVTQTSSTTISVSAKIDNSSSSDIGDLIRAFVTIGMDLVLLDQADVGNRQIWEITSITDNVTYFDFGVTLVSGTFPFSNNQRMIVGWISDDANTSVTIHNDVSDAGSGLIITGPERTNLSNQSGVNTGDEVQATEALLGIAELATQAEADAGSDDLKIITALKLKNLRGIESFFLEAKGEFGAGGGWADSGFITFFPVLFFSDVLTERAIYMFYGASRVKFDVVDPQVLFVVYSSGAPSAGEAVRWTLSCKYRAIGDSVTGASDQTISQTKVLTNLVANTRQDNLIFTLDRALISDQDVIHLNLQRIGGDAADTYGDDIAIGQSGIIVETNQFNP